MDTMIRRCLKVLYGSLCAVLVVQLTGCGTLMYPERRGQRAGRLDVGVTVLDAVGLLFFIVPGVIAFAVDFSNGTIYIPGTARSSLDLKGLKQVKFDPRHGNTVDIAKIIKEQTGYDVKLDQADVKVSKLKSQDEMLVQFAEVLPGIKDKQLSLVR